jgi:hypothetical protein
VGTTTVLTGGGETTNNLVGLKPGFVDAARYDYWLTPHSRAVGAGVNPGQAGDVSLEPRYYHRDPVAGTPRPAGEELDIGDCPTNAS